MAHKCISFQSNAILVELIVMPCSSSAVIMQAT
jgi:hypothetical protein